MHINTLKKLIVWGKGKPPHRLEVDSVRAEISRYCRKRNFDNFVFIENIRDFFDKAQIHHHRIAYRNQIAACLGLDMASSDDRRRLWQHMADERGIDRKTAGRWCSGEIDPPIDKLLLYFGTLAIKCPLPLIDTTEMIRTGIARTLTYIRVLPPQKSNPELDEFELKFQRELNECWSKLRLHEHYWNEQRRNLNQDAIDQVGYQFRDSLWMEPQDLGNIKSIIEGDSIIDEDFINFVEPWLLSYAIFKFSTFSDIVSTNKRKANSNRWIWNPTDHRYQNVWRL